MRMLTKMRSGLIIFALGSIATVAAFSPMKEMSPDLIFSHTNLVLNLWEQGKPAFGIYVPTSAYTVEGAAKLAENPVTTTCF